MKAWKINNETYDNLEDVYDLIFDPEQYLDSEVTSDWLDNEYGDILIRGIHFNASYILANLDEDEFAIAKNENAENYASELRDDYADEIANMIDGETLTIDQYHIICIETNKEEEEEEIEEKKEYQAEEKEIFSILNY